MSQGLPAALDFFQKKQLAQAEAVLRGVLAAEPANSDALHLLGLIAYQGGKNQAAEELVAKAISSNPNVANYFVSRGEIYRALGKPVDAMQCFERALELEPGNTDARNNLGNAMQEQGRLEEAIGQYQRVVALKPEHFVAYYNLGNVLSAKGEHARAELCFRRALALNHDFWMGHNNLGGALLKLGRAEEAARCFGRALALNPDWPEGHANLAAALKSLGRLEEAQTHYARAAALSPSSPVAHFDLAAALHDLGRPQPALESYAKTLVLQPGHVSALNNMANILCDLGRLDEARQCYERAIAFRPDFFEAHNNLARVLRQQGKLEQSAAASARALERNPNSVDAHVNLGITLRSLGRTADAIASYRRALALLPDHRDALNNLGNIYLDLNQLDEAAEYYLRALARDARFFEGQLNLGRVLQEQGLLDQAAKRYRQAFAINPADGIRIRLGTLIPPIPGSENEILDARRAMERNLDILAGAELRIADPIEEVGTPGYFFLSYHGMDDRRLLAKLATLYQKACPSLSYVAPHCRDCKKPAARVKVGFLSRFLQQHSIGKAFAGLIANLDREKFAVSVMTFSQSTDEAGEAIRAAADRSIALPLHLDSARALIAGEELDILVFTDIGMEPLTYFLAYARLAPVQCVGLGHLDTTGLSTIDYFISHGDLEAKVAGEFYTESHVRLKNCAIFPCYPKPALPAAPKSRADFGLSGEHRYYVCGQSLFKLLPRFDECLAGILRADPSGKVLLFEGQRRQWTELIKKRFSLSIADVADRIVFVARMNLPDYLNLLSVCDVILDTCPLSGGISTMDGFATGTPIVTMTGDAMRWRFAEACYQRMGIKPGVANTLEEYVAIAVKLGTDPRYREGIKAKILSRNHALYGDLEAVGEFERFFLEAARECPRPRPAIQYPPDSADA